MRAIVLVPILVLTTLGGACSPRAPVPAPVGPSEEAIVTHVVDGDTIDVARDGRRVTVRLIGIDTPETKRPDTPVECFGPEAHAQLDRLLPAGTAVLLEQDREPTDRYGRELAYVRRRADEHFVNLAMVEDGFAATLTIRPNDRYASVFAEAVDEAKLTRRGLWAACGSAHRPQT